MFWVRVFPPGTESAGGWLPERRDLQRRDPRKRGWYWRVWQPSITAGAPGHAAARAATALTISCFLKPNTHLYLACPLKILQHGRGQQMPMTLLRDSTPCGCSIKYYNSWQPQLLCCFCVFAYSGTLSDLRNELKEWAKSVVNNKSSLL